MTPEKISKEAQQPFYLAGRVFLASRIEALEYLLKEVPPETMGNILFIPTAANNYPPERRAFLYGYRQWFKRHGMPFTEIDVATIRPEELREALRTVNAIVVAGGNTQYLLEHMQKSGFANAVKPCVEQGVWYIGISAGAVVAGPDIFHIKSIEPQQTAQPLSDHTGLTLVPYRIVPHANEPFIQGVIEYLCKQGQEYIAIPDPPDT